MARVLVTHGYFYRLDPKQWADGRPYPPLGTLWSAAVLREAGHEVHFFDTALRRSPDELLPVLEALKPDVVVIHDDGFNYLTKMCLTVMREACHRMIALARAQGARVSVCSSDSTDHPELYLEKGADAIVLGEGEETERELLQRWSTGAPWEDVAGIAHRAGGSLRTNPRRPVLRDLDALPAPAWDLLDTAPYRAIWHASQGFFSLNVATTRGCPFKCNWCAKPIYGNRYNSRSPEAVVREIAELQRRFAPDHLWMCDDIFGLKPGWVRAFRDALRREGLRIRYKVQSRADLLLEDDAIALLAESGLEEVWIGAESGSQRILDAMDKGITVAQIAEARRKLNAHGVRVGFFLQFGYLGETPADVERTLAMLDELMPDDIGISVSYPLPGTKFFEKVKDELGAKRNWTDSDDLAMMFRQEQRPAYYRRLHRYVHKRFRRRQALLAWRSLAQGGSAPFRRLLSTVYYVPAAMLDRGRLALLAR
ncbi:MAG: B12-binding domain-containing radical SAM protein [Flavobacteriales bacterium]|nr:B12-binding domain-containing radical SAM protein [Flavobacteriales bacterium]